MFNIFKLMFIIKNAYVYIYIYIHIHGIYIYIYTSLYLFMVMTWGWFRMWVPGSNRFRAPGTQPFFYGQELLFPIHVAAKEPRKSCGKKGRERERDG